MNRRLTMLSAITLAAAVLVGAAQFSKQKKTHLGGSASSMIRLTGYNLFVGTQVPLVVIDQQGQELGPLTLSKGTVLVVTDLLASVNGTPVAGVTRGGLIAPSGIGSTDPVFSFDTTKQTQCGVHLSGGVVWSVVPDAINAGDSKNAVFLQVYGYLAKDQ